MLIPQGMAYALLAGLPPITGLYASLVPLMIYPLFGTSRQLSVGPVAMDSLIVAAGLSMFARQGTEDYLSLALLLALMVGLIQLALGFLKLGFIVNFLSQPLINGFTSAAAIIIGLSQVKHLFGIEISGSQQVYKVIFRIYESLEFVNYQVLVLGLSCIVLLYFGKKIGARFPSALILIILSIIVVWYFRLDQNGTQIVGEIPAQLPEFGFQLSYISYIPELLPTALALSLIGYTESIAIAKKTAAQKGYKIHNNKELIALGMANAGAGLFGAFPIAGSFSRTAVNVHAGARTSMASVFAALLVLVIILFLTPLFYFLSKAVLAAIVVVAVLPLIDLKEPIRLYKVKKTDFLVLIFAFIATLLLGAQLGIMIGILASIILIIRRISYPNVAILGRIPGTNVFRNIKNESKAIEVEGVIIFRIDASLYYANSLYLKDKIQQSIAGKDNVHLFILDASSINEIDATAIQTLMDLHNELKEEEINFYITNLKEPVKDTLERSGFFQIIGREKVYYKNEDVLNMYSDKYDKSNNTV